MMVKASTCPKCGTCGLETVESGQLVCTACGSRFAVAAGRADSLLLCPQCGFVNKPEAASCSECGAALAKHCPRCGAKLEMRMRFCDQCGASHEGLASPDGRCHWCGLQNQSDAKLCTKCGARLIMACPRCESEMKADLNFCRTCGLDYQTLLETEEEES